MTAYKPKLIEVALPLVAINDAAGAEGSTGQRPHAKNLHRWWARRPLSAARAVLWASLIDDPSGDVSLSDDAREAERLRLFRILERLVAADTADDQTIWSEARQELARCFPDGLPTVLDPFGGGGAIPLEAQRLGLKAVTGDLNPVPVLIQRAMLQLPVRFRSRAPVHADAENDLQVWQGAQGLATDVELYGRWMRDEAARKVGYMYPPVPQDSGGDETVIAWIWARTVMSPDPTWRAHVPLVASWVLSRKAGKPTIWIEPRVDREAKAISYVVRHGGTPTHSRTVDNGNGTCIATGATILPDYIKSEAVAGRLKHQLIAIVSDGQQGKKFHSPLRSHEVAADVEPPKWRPQGRNPERLTGGTVVVYGLDEWWKLFTNRQLNALTTFSDLLAEVHEKVCTDAVAAGLSSDGARFRDGGMGAMAYADAITTYLAFVLDKYADFGNSLCSWNAPNSQVRYLFADKSIPMKWDFVETNPFSGKMASWDAQLSGLVAAVRDCLATGDGPEADVAQMDAGARVSGASDVVISMDPPYYANIFYSDLSDFFYSWLRVNVGDIWPDECATLQTPKAEELVANRYRAGSKAAADQHFEQGMSHVMTAISSAQRSDVPATIYYAYKATETADGAIRSTGWATFLQAVVDAGLQVTATWPLRTERRGRLVSIGTNALASSILLVCRSRPINASLASRAEFIESLREEMPAALNVLQSGNIAPVDLAQSTIGPGISVFSRYARVIEADGSNMPVSDALAIINDVLSEALDGEETELDADTRFAVTWYTQFGYGQGPSGDADNLARAKNTSLPGLQAAGIGEARGGSFRLFDRSELPEDWDPIADSRRTVWEATQHLVAALDRSETEAARLLHRLGGYGERARQLAYVLFKKATDKGSADEATAYNGLIMAWPVLQTSGSGDSDPQQLLL